MGSTPTADTKPLISVCICTYRRPKQLQNLLESLNEQRTDGLLNFSIVVVDNDAGASGRSVVERCAERLSVPIVYHIEPEQSISLARNASVAIAIGELVAFVDDDEEPVSDWLCRLYQALIQYGVDGVLGPVIPKFDDAAPRWAVEGTIFRRPTFTTGTVMDSTSVGIGNALVKRNVLLELEIPFRPEFGAGGEDRDFLRRAIARGRTFVWSAEAVCYEPVPHDRTRLTFQLRRALLRGKVALRGPGGRWRGIVKSVVAVPLYAVALPLCLMMGTHVFVSLLIRAFDHIGKLLASCGIDLVGDKYIT